MKTKQISKIFCDIAMTVTFFFLVLGVGNTAFHEVLGISVAALYILHIVLNFSWIKHIFKAEKLSKKDKIYICLDLLLLVGMIVIIVTGILISQVIFSFDNDNLMLCSSVHHVASYITLGVMGAHIGIHLEYLLEFIAKTAKSLFKKSGLKVLSSAAALTAVFVIVYSMINSAYQGKLDAQAQDFAMYNKQTTTSQATTTTQSTTTEESTREVTTREETTEKKTTETTTKEKTTTTNATTTTTQTTSAVPTLNDFLGKMFCTGCSRHCSLLAPQCQKGMQQTQVAEQEYNNEYSN